MSEVRRGYKQTKVGVIPEDWEVAPLHSLAERIMTANESLVLSQTNESTHGIKRMPTEVLFALQVALPEESEQVAIASVLSDMDSALSAIEAKLAKTRQLKQGMMQNLLTDKIRLV